MMPFPVVHPGIAAAASESTAYLAALSYADLGLSVIPTNADKTPAISWQRYQRERANHRQITQWRADCLFGGVGIICGAISRNLVVIDLDGEDAVFAFQMRFPQLLETYAVTSGSGRGAHYYYRLPHSEPTCRVTASAFGNVELRSDGCYVIAPPSIHPSGKPYTIHQAGRVLALDTLKPVSDWIKSLMRNKHNGHMPPPTGKIVQASPYARAALAGECAAVSNAAQGGRNNALNRAAFKLGQLVAGGKIARHEVERGLYDAARAEISDQGEQSVLKTIKSGIEAGMSKPPTHRDRQ